MTSTFGRSLGQSMSSPQLGLSASMEGIPNLPGFRQSPATPKQVKQSLRVQHGYMLVRSGVPLRPITAPAPGTVALQRSMSFAGCWLSSSTIHSGRTAPSRFCPSENFFASILVQSPAEMPAPQLQSAGRTATRSGRNTATDATPTEASKPRSWGRRTRGGWPRS